MLVIIVIVMVFYVPKDFGQQNNLQVVVTNFSSSFLETPSISMNFQASFLDFSRLGFYGLPPSKTRTNFKHYFASSNGDVGPLPSYEGTGQQIQNTVRSCMYF